MGNFKRAKFPSFLKGKLGRVQTRKHTRSLSKIYGKSNASLGDLSAQFQAEFKKH